MPCLKTSLDSEAPISEARRLLLRCRHPSVWFVVLSELAFVLFAGAEPIFQRFDVG